MIYFVLLSFMLAQVLTLTMMDRHRFLCQADDFGADEEVKTHPFSFHPSIQRRNFFFLRLFIFFRVSFVFSARSICAPMKWPSKKKKIIRDRKLLYHLSSSCVDVGRLYPFFFKKKIDFGLLFASFFYSFRLGFLFGNRILSVEMAIFYL